MTPSDANTQIDACANTISAIEAPTETSQVSHVACADQELFLALARVKRERRGVHRV